jgi:hypothetical protein
MPPLNLLPLVQHGWITTAQAQFGTSLSDIRTQLRGDTVPGLALQAELSALWTMNPAGKVGEQGTASNSTFERMRGLGGGLTWALDSELCKRLLPRFSEDAVVLHVIDLVDCAGVRASVARAFSKWSDNNRNLQFVDVTDECSPSRFNGAQTHAGLQQESLELCAHEARIAPPAGLVLVACNASTLARSRVSPHRPSNSQSAELRQRRREWGSEFSEFHGGCPFPG